MFGTNTISHHWVIDKAEAVGFGEQTRRQITVFVDDVFIIRADIGHGVGCLTHHHKLKWNTDANDLLTR